MKKLLATLLTLTILVSSAAITVSAESAPQEGSRSAQRVPITERIEEKRSEFIEGSLGREERQAKMLDIIILYAPDYYDAYVEAFDEHNALHDALFEAHVAKAEENFEAAQAALDAYKDELWAQFKNGEVTLKEMREALKVFGQELRAEFEAEREAVRLAAEAWLEENGNDKEEIEALRAALKDAIENEDQEAAYPLIVESYEHQLVHIEFDVFKLSLLTEE